jgi:hypothetical protein
MGACQRGFIAKRNLSRSASQGRTPAFGKPCWDFHVRGGAQGWQRQRMMSGREHGCLPARIHRETKSKPQRRPEEGAHVWEAMLGISRSRGAQGATPRFGLLPRVAARRRVRPAQCADETISSALDASFRSQPPPKASPPTKVRRLRA